MRGMAAGTEVAGMLLAKSTDPAAGIMAMESTALVSSIMTVSAAIGSIITRTGQSTMNGTGTANSNDTPIPHVDVYTYANVEKATADCLIMVPPGTFPTYPYVFKHIYR